MLINNNSISFCVASKPAVTICPSPLQHHHSQFPKLFSHNINQPNHNATTSINTTPPTNSTMDLTTKDGTTQDTKVMVAQVQSNSTVQLPQHRPTTTTTNNNPKPKLKPQLSVSRTTTFQLNNTIPKTTRPLRAHTDSCHLAN